MPRGSIVCDRNRCNKGVEARAEILLARQATAQRGVFLERDCISVCVAGKGVEMRVMRVGRTIDRAVWLAKRGGECQKFDPETVAGINPLQMQNLCSNAT